MARAPVLCPTQRERWSRAWAGRPPAQGRQPPGVGADADAGRWAQTRALRRLISSGSCVLSCVLCSWRDASLVRVQRLHPNELVAAAGAPPPRRVLPPSPEHGSARAPSLKSGRLSPAARFPQHRFPGSEGWGEVLGGGRAGTRRSDPKLSAKAPVGLPGLRVSAPETQPDSVPALGI